MPKSKFIKNIVFPVLIMIMAETAIFSREKADSLMKPPKFFIGISAGPSMNSIISTGINTVSDLTSLKKNTYSGSYELELGYFFSGPVGISTGIGYNSYSSELSLGAYSNKFNTKDSEGEDYERRVSGSNIKELQNISYLSVPVCLNFRIPAGTAFGLFLKAGVNFSFPQKHEYNSSGTFDFSGYYSAYNVVLHDLPAYGFSSNSIVSTKGDPELKPYDIEGLAIAGFQCTIKRKFQIAVGASYSRSLSTISNYSATDEFQLTSDIDRINSMMGGCKNSIAESIGLRLTFRYYIR
jgi:hypothetical protein